MIDESMSTSPTDAPDDPVLEVGGSCRGAPGRARPTPARRRRSRRRQREAVVIAESADELVEQTLDEAADEADGLEAQGDHEAAEAVVEQAVEDAVEIEAAGEAAAEEVLADAVTEAPDAGARGSGRPSPRRRRQRQRPSPRRPRRPRLRPSRRRPPPIEQPPAAEDPFGGPGDWYVVHTYAGYENKVKTNLESRIHTMQMEDKIFHVHIPMEDVMEIKAGKKQVVQKKVFPGYLLVKMWYDNDSWYVVRNTPGVTGFVSAGTGSKPTPLSKREIDKILVVKKEEVKPQFRLGFEEGDIVRIISGPFADFNGTINEINVDQSKLKVLVNIFDRETPVELGFDQVSKV